MSWYAGDDELRRRRSAAAAAKAAPAATASNEQACASDTTGAERDASPAREEPDKEEAVPLKRADSAGDLSTWPSFSNLVEQASLTEPPARRQSLEVEEHEPVEATELPVESAVASSSASDEEPPRSSAQSAAASRALETEADDVAAVTRRRRRRPSRL